MSFKDWYTKKRTGWVFGFTNWIISSPKAFEILLTMSFLMSTFIFGGLTFIAFWYNWNPFAKSIFPVCLVLVLYQLKKLRKIKKQMGSVFETLNIKELMGGFNDGHKQTSDGENNWRSEQRTGKNYTSITERLRCYKGQSERADTSTGNDISSTGSSGEEPTEDRWDV